MKELKTLKDFELVEEGQGLVIDWIKVEAVKDRKHINPDMSVLDYIEWKFNLTEDDLK